jgi:hypothetical protein
LVQSGLCQPLKNQNAASRRQNHYLHFARNVNKSRSFAAIRADIAA